VTISGGQGPGGAGSAGQGEGGAGGEGEGSAGQGGEGGGCAGDQCGPPSCASGLQCQGVDCCQSIVLPGGTFNMGRCGDSYGAETCTDGYEGLPDEVPEHEVTLSSFALDTFEVTVGRFRAFVDAYTGTPPAAGAGASPHVESSGWDSTWNENLPATQEALISNVRCSADYQTWTNSPGANESAAINCVSWYEAFAFCAWDGGRLPTEAEWEYAAVGGSENRLYPWGPEEPWTNAYANDAYSDTSFSSTDEVQNGKHDLPVGSRPAGSGLWGHRDFAGGMFEWTFDRYDANWYSGEGATCTDCANVTSGSQRVPRGGGWFFGTSAIHPTQRGKDTPTSRFDYLGFRCARTP
jgi:formylglycine-generating enzyme